MKKLFDEFEDYCVQKGRFFGFMSVVLCILLPVVVGFVFLLNLSNGLILLVVPAYAAYIIWKWRKDDVH